MALKQQEEAIINLVINGQQAKTSLTEVSGVVNKLTADLRKMHEADDPKLYAEKLRTLERMRATQNSMREAINGTTSAWTKFKDALMATAAGVIGANAIQSVIQTIISFVPKMLSAAGELSDQLSDIQKTTGMTSGEVEKLNSALGKIDTRTKAKDLRDIAISAGQLGVSAKDVLGFTDAIDKVNVALGDEFQGGAKEVSDTIGKLRNVLTDIKSDKIDVDITHIGNALNVLGAEGLATGPVVADFASRIGGAGVVLGLTSGQVLGLSATLQELNVDVERGSSAVITVLQKMLTNTREFAGVAGMNVNDFKKLLDTDLYGALTRVTQGMGSSKASAVAFAKLLDDLKLDGKGTTEVMAKLGASTEMLTTRVKDSTSALKNSNSIMAEFDLKNQNLAANLEKLSKRMASWWNSSAIKNFFADVVGSMASTETAADKLVKKYQEHKQEFEQMNANASPLITTYDTLKSKTTLAADEQAKLHSITKQLAELLPSAVTAWDKHGNALDINIGKVKEYLKEQKELLQFQNKDAIKSTEKDIESLMVDRQKQNELLRTGKRKNIFGKEKDATNQDLIEARAKVREIEVELDKKVLLWRALTGKSPDDAPKPTETPKAPPAKVTPITVISKEEQAKIDARKKAADEEYAALVEKARSFNAKALADMKSADDKERLLVAEKYDAMIIEQQKGLDDLKKNDQSSAKERSRIQAIIDKLKTDKQKELGALTIRQEKDIADKTKELLQAVADHRATLYDKEVDDINKKYDAIAKNASQNAATQATIQAERQKALDQAKLNNHERLLLEIAKLDDGYQKTVGSKDDQERATINKKYDDIIADLKSKFDANKELFDEIDKLNGERSKELKHVGKKAPLDQKQVFDYAIGAAQDTVNAVFSIKANGRQKELNAQLQHLEDLKNAELSKHGLTQKQKDAINEKYAKKEAEEKLKAWKADQSAKEGQAIINGALAITKTFAEFGWPYGIIPAAAQAIATGAEIAVIASEDPPQYYTGVRGADEGLAYVGERGPEIIEEDGSLRLADSGPQLTYLKKGANVYKANDTADIYSGKTTKNIAASAFNKMNQSAASVSFNEQNYSRNVDAIRFGQPSQSQTVNQPGAVSSSQVDLSTMHTKMDEMIAAQHAANEKELVFNYYAFERFQEKILKARYQAGKKG